MIFKEVKFFKIKFKNINMSASSDYYKLIRLRLAKSKQAFQKENLSDNIQTDIDEANSDGNSCKLETEKSDISLSLINFKEDQLKKWHNFALQTYFTKISHIKPTTKKYYLQIILEFIRFSPEIDPEDIWNFMEYKFKLKQSDSEFNIPYSKTQSKYANAIRRFVQNIYTIDPLRIKCQYYKNKSRVAKEFPPKLTYQNIFEVYSTLISHKKIEDALILNFIYTYAINPYVIYTLTYEGIDENGFITYWDFKSSSNTVKPLHTELLNDIKLFKLLTSSTKKIDFVSERTSPNYTVIRGTFIFSVTPTNIFNRFKRKFGIKSMKLSFTPGDVIKLSKYMTRKHDSNYYPKITILKGQ